VSVNDLERVTRDMAYELARLRLEAQNANSDNGFALPRDGMPSPPQMAGDMNARGV